MSVHQLSRRELLSIVAGTTAGSVLGPAAAYADNTPPNAGSANAPKRLGSDSAPDIVMIILDDVGYGDLGCFGSEVATPAIDHVARDGLRYTNFHVTSACTPTRACLLTGRNAHRVGAGTIAEFSRDEPGYRGWMSRDAGTIAEVLRPHGYATLAVGKWHLSPLSATNAAGPFDQWPTGRGFDKWYGFQGPLADHWHPELWENTQAVVPSRGSEYHLSTDLTSRAIAYVRDHVSSAPDRPYFLQLAYGACHWPLHVPRNFIDRYRGRYDDGWEAVRRSRFERQRSAGLIPTHAGLVPMNPGIPKWDELSAAERAFAARAQETYAAFLEHTDVEIGRLLDTLSMIGRLDNTLILILSDNGASREGGRIGMSDVRRNHYITPETPEELFSALEELGGDNTFAAYPQGWAQVSNTPLKWYKSNTFGGGIRAPLIVRWPRGGLPGGEDRHQYHHAVDIAPTLMEIAGVDLPEHLDGVAQMPLDGISMQYTFTASPTSPTRKQVQHYESYGDRAIWAHGWKALTRHRSGTPFDDDTWELYRLESDFSELQNLADRYPERVEALKTLWYREAAANKVLPLDDRTTEFFAANVLPQRHRYVFFAGMARIDRLSSPDISAHDHRITADLKLGTPPGNGVLVAFGTSVAGYELTLQDGVLVYDYVFSRSERTTVRARRSLDTELHIVGLTMTRTGSTPEEGATVQLTIDDEVVGEGRIPRLWRTYAASAGLRCGLNPTAPISRAYEGPFAFDGILHRLTFEMDL